MDIQARELSQVSTRMRWTEDDKTRELSPQKIFFPVLWHILGYVYIFFLCLVYFSFFWLRLWIQSEKGVCYRLYWGGTIVTYTSTATLAFSPLPPPLHLCSHHSCYRIGSYALEALRDNKAHHKLLHFFCITQPQWPH